MTSNTHAVLGDYGMIDDNAGYGRLLESFKVQDFDVSNITDSNHYARHVRVLTQLSWIGRGRAREAVVMQRSERCAT